jgi:hypothetical protein
MLDRRKGDVNERGPVSSPLPLKPGMSPLQPLCTSACNGIRFHKGLITRGAFSWATFDLERQRKARPPDSRRSRGSASAGIHPTKP